MTTRWGKQLALLTPAERSVADLVATGASNVVIASTLGISRHTVESHLKHAFQKLGIRSRVELAVLVAEERDPRPKRRVASADKEGVD